MAAIKNTKKKEIVRQTESRLHDYEIVFIVSPEVDDEPLEATINSVSQFISGKGGTVLDVERWGKRRLAYPIKRFMEGNYVLARFSMDPAWSKALEANMCISEVILRHLLIEVDGKIVPKAKAKVNVVAEAPADTAAETKTNAVAEAPADTIAETKADAAAENGAAPAPQAEG